MAARNRVNMMDSERTLHSNAQLKLHRDNFGECSRSGVLCGCQFIIKPPREKAYASPESLEIKMNVFMHMPSNLDIVPIKTRVETALRQKCSLQTAFPHLTSTALSPRIATCKVRSPICRLFGWAFSKAISPGSLVAEATSEPGSSSL